MSARLKYRIVKYSTEDPEYPAAELLVHSSQTKGWQTARFCDFPQELLLQFETPVHLRQIQFLSHQSKIATKIELFTAQPSKGPESSSYDQVKFHRLGYLSLDSNERSQFQARELKSVYVDVSAQYLKILLHKCHINKYNLVNQVGLIALNCLGETLGPDLAIGPPGPNPVSIARGSSSDDVPAPHRSRLGDAAEAAEELGDEMKYEAKTLERIRALNQAKNRAVEEEDYEEAKRCKELLARLRQLGITLKELEEKKKQAVANEDYDAAKALKVEIDRLRSAIERPQSFNERPEPVQRAPSNDRFETPPQHHQPMHHQQEMPPQAASLGPTAPRGTHQPVMQAPPSPQGGFPGSAGVSEREPPESHGFGPGGSSALGSRKSSQGHLPMSAEGSMPGGHSDMPSPAAHMPRQGGTGSSAPPPAPYGNQGVPNFGHDMAPPRAHEIPQSPKDGYGAPPEPDGFNREASSASHAFDSAGHPLAGVQNIDDLQGKELEPLGKAFEKEAEPIVDCFGEYIARCVYSKTWNLREASLEKLTIDHNSGVHDKLNSNEMLAAVSTIFKRVIPDKIAQVFVKSVGLLHALCDRLLEPLRKQDVQSAFNAAMPALVERLGDANARVSDGANQALLRLARCNSVGPQFVANFLLTPPKKKNVHARVYTSRLNLLNTLAAEVGLEPVRRGGIPLDQTMNLAMDWFGNADANVRNAAVQLVATCHDIVGLQKIERWLKDLRPAQREVFNEQFEKGHGAPSPSSAGGSPKQQQQFNSARGPAGPSHDGMSPQAQSDEAEDEPFICPFCGREDPSFTPEGLDMHYWKDCPMLIQCEFCEQVVETSGLVHHWREECEKEQPAQSASVGLTEFQCPMCHIDLSPGDDVSWKRHLMGEPGCPRNPRSLCNQ